MSKRFFEIFNYSSLGAVFVLVVLMLTRAVPGSWYVPLLIIGFVLLIFRIIFRIYFVIQSKKKNEV